MSDEIEVSMRNVSGVAIIDVSGDVTATTGEVLEDIYQKVSDAGLKKIVLCFDKGCYINSGGIAILIGIVAESGEHEQVIRITGLSDHFHRIFDMVGLTRYADVFPSEDAALNSWL